MPTITLTPNISLQIPSYDLSNWQVPIGYDLQLLDQLLSGAKALPELLVTGAVQLGTGSVGISPATAGGLAIGNGTTGDQSAAVYAGSFHGDGSHLTNLSQLNVVPSWTQYLITMSAGSWLVNGTAVASISAATTQQIALFTTQTTQIFHGIVIKHWTAFAGTSISDVVSSVGYAATPDALMLATGDTFDLAQTVSATHFYVAGGVRSLGFAATPVIVQLTATGANLSALTAGSFEIDVCSAVLP